MHVLNKKRVLPIIAKLIRDLDLAKEYDRNSMDFKIVVQKIGYLVQKIGGLDFGLEFEWLSRGPYSRSLQNYYHTVFQYLSQYPDNIPLDDVETSAMNRVENLLKAVREVLGNLDVRILEAVASLIMLCSDVYPIPEDPVNELVKKKGLSREIVLKIFNVVKEYGICI
jgi:uncharacterized protein YwgA